MLTRLLGEFYCEVFLHLYLITGRIAANGLSLCESRYRWHIQGIFFALSGTGAGDNHTRYMEVLHFV